MNERSRTIRSILLRRYYKSAILGWKRPLSYHWAKIVDDKGQWRWTKSHQGIRGRLLRNPPVHLYQTICRFKTNGPPRGHKVEGYFLGGPLIFDADLTDKNEPVSLWKLIDSVNLVHELNEYLLDRGDFYLKQVLFSGMRGIHVLVDNNPGLEEPVQLSARRSKVLIDHIRERFHLARSVGKWCRGWDWNVSADIWRVSRVAWSLHGASALRTVPLRKPFTASSFKQQLRDASPFSYVKRLKIRTTRNVPIFTFVNGETYGPYRKGWTTKLPIAVALHLIWLDLAKPRESGPSQAGAWFDRGWQILFRGGVNRRSMVVSQEGVSAV